VYLSFLLEHHRLVQDKQWGGAVGVREAISQLQGFEMPAGAWESRVLAARIAEYDPAWLDNLFFSGEVVWGRLTRPRRDEDDAPSAAGLSRVVPISLALRETLPLLLPPRDEGAPPKLRSGAERVLEVLTRRGALFFNELAAVTQMLPGHLEEALRELAAQGLITSDAFAAVRKLSGGDASRSRRRARRPLHGAAAPIGRWSLFPGLIEPAPTDKHVEHWCRQLLARYGIVFRDVIARETAAPSWQTLVGVLRRMELRGELRGGRFVTQVSGEQYALPETVDRLRESRDTLDKQPWTVISAADPVNLFGVITPGVRVPATHRNALVVQGGRVIATRVAGVAEFHAPLDAATSWAMRKAMTLGRRPTEEMSPGLMASS
jgi:ATP-dependent Lhr-like helicase